MLVEEPSCMGVEAFANNASCCDWSFGISTSLGVVSLRGHILVVLGFHSLTVVIGHKRKRLQQPFYALEFLGHI